MLNNKWRKVMKIQINYQQGMGLIEVLVSAVVVSIGLLSIASMQGNFLSGTGENKARAQAIVFAEQKIEDFRNTATKTQYLALVSGTDTKTGDNAEFTRIWTLVSLIAPDRKSIVVTVTWSAGSVTLNSELAWNIVGNASIYSSTGGNSGMAASLLSPSSDAGVVEGIDAIDPSAVADGYGFQIYRNADGKQVVADALYNEGGGRQLTCGHVCLSVKGNIYLPSDSFFEVYEKIRDDDVTVCSWKLDNNNIPVTTSENVNGTPFSTREYICYFGGDCAAETSETYVAADCPADYATLPEVNVTGGWRGNIGIVGFGANGHGADTLCFVGQVAGTTRRNYRTIRNGTSEEGINTNYQCHDFFMVNNNGNSADACDAYVGIAASHIIKELSSDVPNKIATNIDSCSSVTHSFSGVVAGSYNERSRLTISISSGSCVVGPVGPAGPNTTPIPYNEYTCEIDGTHGDILTLGVSSAKPNASPSLTSTSITLGVENLVGAGGTGPNISH